MRDFMETMRASGIQSGGPSALSPRDRQQFANDFCCQRNIAGNYQLARLHAFHNLVIGHIKAGSYPLIRIKHVDLGGCRCVSQCHQRGAVSRR
jgi:hypothetical protein